MGGLSNDPEKRARQLAGLRQGWEAARQRYPQPGSGQADARQEPQPSSQAQPGNAPSQAEARLQPGSSQAEARQVPGTEVTILPYPEEDLEPALLADQPGP